MEGLPKLPGMNFENRLKLRHNMSHCFAFKNGYTFPVKPPIGPGGEPLKEDSIAFVSQNDSVLYDPVLTYGRVKHPPVPQFKPRYVIYDKVLLGFRAFFKQSIPESMLEHYRVRYVNIIYFMEDDTITVMEPRVLNSGFPQGRLIRRGKIPKNVQGDFYTWKDLNVGIDIELLGIVFHITDCDEYTKEFLAAQGIELNDIESMPVDPVTSTRMINSIQKVNKTPSDDDKLRRYLEFQGKVLAFDCVLDETDREYGELMTYKLYYFLEDDTVAVRELKENQEGRDHFPMLLKRTKLPYANRMMAGTPTTYPSIYLERTDHEVTEYYQPKHFIIGETIFVYGRKFLLLDCDPFTRKYFEQMLRIPQKPKLEIKFPENRPAKREIPKYLGLGTPEDSMASCMGLVPKAPKKNIIGYLLNANKFLRFGCVLDNAHPEDDIRKFILKISLSDGTIAINEPPIRNSGIKGGKFLSPQLVVRPGSNPDRPGYYTTKDFYIGATVIIHCHRFKIISADLYVYHYMKEHPELFAPDAIDGVRNYCLLEGNLRDELKEAIRKECLEYKKEKEEAEPEPERSYVENCLEAMKQNQAPVEAIPDERPPIEADYTCKPTDPEAIAYDLLDEADKPQPVIERGQEFLAAPCAEAVKPGGGSQKKRVTFK